MKENNSKNIDAFLREKKIDGKTKIDIALLLELMHGYADFLSPSNLPTDEEISDEKINALFPVDNSWAVEDKALNIGKRIGAKFLRDKLKGGE